MDISTLNINHVNHKKVRYPKKTTAKVNKAKTLASVKRVNLDRVMVIIERCGRVQKVDLVNECPLHITTINNAIKRLESDGNIKKISGRKNGLNHVVLVFIKS